MTETRQTLAASYRRGGTGNDHTQQIIARKPDDFISKYLQSIIPFKSMCDLGCGPGYWVNVARKMGIEDAMGYDIPVAEGQSRLIESLAIESSATLRTFDHFGRRFDLAVSTEVVEHIPQGKEGILHRELLYGFGFRPVFRRRPLPRGRRTRQ